MDYAPRTMMEMSVALLVFLVAAGSGLMLFQTGTSLNTLAYVTGQSQDRNVQQTYVPLSGDGLVSGTEVLQAIARLEEGDAEMVVDGVRFVPPLDREQLSSAGIRLKGRYQPTYDRDAAGHLQRLTLRSLP
ncbi:hypothetical protein BSK66_24835 [Paenibacillus odorifer]|uniref:hypothetical protein n=1 Tax=Paenibacillus TaxID=44249 RepID=UPI0003E2AE6A|nr:MULTISPECIES: hypothetical protein [Paenibacillus]ETT54821.1 hypothetical protein C171_20174 [Paenibacillus sp. FSL H8-237]OME50694.1 hypothetical protein BSK66_24835 [Paenibacillus odorifer]SIR49795.1 hypothetical protein SAMN05880555_3991 [Paenibacillus sp. RU4X]SIR58807.1 hypothetical protein SAMN05880570_3994 [Paenibacillus sp. RU4T]